VNGPAVRCFIAIDLSSDVRAAIAWAQTRVRTAAAHADVRWVDPAQFHLTLKFLGAVPDGRVAAVSGALEAAVAGTSPVGLVAAGLGGFPSLRSARVLWAGIAAGVPEGRPFQGHLTIARVRSPRAGRALAAAVEAAGAPAFGSWTASEVVLYESRLKPTGALYTPVSRHPLRGVRS